MIDYSCALPFVGSSNIHDRDARIHELPEFSVANIHNLSLQGRDEAPGSHGQGVITLWGRVGSPFDRDKLVELANRVQSVTK